MDRQVVRTVTHMWDTDTTVYGRPILLLIVRIEYLDIQYHKLLHIADTLRSHTCLQDIELGNLEYCLGRIDMYK